MTPQSFLPAPPPPGLLASEQPQAPSPQSTVLPRILCWLLIIAAVVFEMGLNISKSSAPSAEDAGNPNLPLMARYTVGAHAVMKSAQAADAMSPIVAQLDQISKTAEDRLRVAIISKEVESPVRADERLVKLSASDLPKKVRQELSILQDVYRDGPDQLSSTDRQLLLDREEWFGKVALSYGRSDTDPTRSGVLAQAKRTCVVLLAGFSTVGIALVVGFALMVTAIIFASIGRVRLAYRKPFADSVFLEAFAVYLVGFLLVSLFLHYVLRVSGLGWTLALTVMLPVGLMWPVWRGRSWEITREGFGWNAGRGVVVELAIGLVGYIAALPFLAICFAVTYVLIKLAGATPSHPIVGYVTGGGSQIALLYFIACVWAPVFEETMFRGALFNHLRGRHRWWLSALIVGFIFAAIHPQGWTLIPVLGGIGVVLCALREWRGSLLAPMAAHALNNFTMLTLLVLAMH